MDPAAIRQLMLAVVPSVVVSLVVMWGLWWRAGAKVRGESAAGGLVPVAAVQGPWWAAGLVMAGLVAVIFGLAESRWYVPPTSRKDWVPLIAVGAAVLGLVLGGMRAGEWRGAKWVIGWGVRGLAAGLVGLACAWPRVMNTWSMGESAAWLGGFAAVVVIVWWSIARVTERTTGAQGPLAVMLLAAGASQVLVLGYASFDQAQLVTIIAAAAGPMWVLGMLRPNFTLAREGACVAVLVIAAATLQSMLYGAAEGPARWSMGPLMLSGAVLGLLADVPLVARRGGLVRGLVRIALMTAPAGAAVAMGVMTKVESAY
jgi:hypothetical protein